MALCHRGLLQTRLPFVDFRRFRGKINIQRPKKPHYVKQVYIDLTEPYYKLKREEIPLTEFCSKAKTFTRKTQIDNPFEHILAKECLNWFNHSKVVAILHLNPISAEDEQPIFARLRKADMHLRLYGKKVMELAITGTRYEPVYQLFNGHNKIVFCQNDDVAKLLKILKKAPQMVLMAAIVNGRLMSKNEVIEYSQLPNLKTAQSQLCQVLQSAGLNIHSQLNSAQSTLVSHLNQHADSQEESSENDVPKE